MKIKENLGYKNKIIKLHDNSKKERLIVKRLKINKKANAILPKIISVLNNYYTNNNLTYLIPTSIRTKDDKEIQISNLTLPLYLQISKNDSWNEIYIKMYKALKEKKNLNLSNIKYGLLVRQKSKSFKAMIKISKFIQKKTRRYFTCGSITNLGIINSQNYKCDKMKFNSLFCIPFYQPLLPLVVTIVENVESIEILLVTRSNIISEVDVNEILEQISIKLNND